jgi:hypothetical protein
MRPFQETSGAQPLAPAHEGGTGPAAPAVRRPARPTDGGLVAAFGSVHGHARAVVIVAAPAKPHAG